MRIIASLICIAFCATQAVAASIKVIGYGDTKKDAEKDALIRAVRMVTGVSISNEHLLAMTATSSGVSSRDNDSEYTHEERSEIVKQLSSNAAFSTKGRVSGYEVLSIRKSQDEGYEAELDVDICKYNSPGLNPNNRRKMVILPFEIERSETRIAGKSYSMETLAQRQEEKINLFMTQSRRFTILDRRYDKAVNDELSRIKSAGASPDDLVMLGQRLAADYIVVGDMRMLDDPTDIEHTGDYDKLILSYRVIVVATTQVKWSNTITISAAGAKGSTVDEFVENLLTHGAHRLQESLLEAIYPIYVIKVDKAKKEVCLNRGGEGMHIGTTYDVYIRGEELFDPISHESLGFEETPIATIRITQVETKYSRATIIKGSVPDSKGTNLSIKRSSDKTSGSAPNEATSFANSENRDNAKSLVELRASRYTELERVLVRIKKGALTSELLSEAYRLRKQSPSAAVRSLVLKAVGSGMIAVGDEQFYSSIKKNIPNRSALEDEMLDVCSRCNGSGLRDGRCSSCLIDGKCRSCSGKGTVNRLDYGGGHFLSHTFTCRSCGGSGRCSRCGGSGNVNKKCLVCLGKGKKRSRGVARDVAMRYIDVVLNELAEARRNEK